MILDNQEENLVKPEFEGLWNKKVLLSDDHVNQYKFPTCYKSKAEKVKI